MRLNPAHKESAALTLRCCARGMRPSALPNRLSAGLAVLLYKHPFPQSCREVHHARRLPI
jgi:hypothetical protein